MNAYELKAGIGVIAGKYVWSLPERLACTIKTICNLPFTFFLQRQQCLQPIHVPFFRSLHHQDRNTTIRLTGTSTKPTIVHITFLWAPAQRKRATMLYFANVYLFIFLWPPYSPALVNGGSRKFYTWWTLSVVREVTTWIFSWSSLNYRVGQKVTKFRIFSDPARKLAALTPERGRIL